MIAVVPNVSEDQANNEFQISFKIDDGIKYVSKKKDGLSGGAIGKLLLIYLEIN